MQTGKSTVTTLDENTAKIKVLVGGMIGGFMGMDNQGNSSVFTQHYAINTFTSYSAANSMKSSLAHQNSFTTAQVSNTLGNFTRQ